jgi:sulfite reductase beta subunit-like hemoprotein
MANGFHFSCPISRGVDVSSIQEANTLGRARLSFAKESEIDEFIEVLDRFERGEIGPDAWRAFRLVRGVYGQRQAEDGQMLRVKIPQGVLVPAQLNALADIAERYSRGFGHITTRQNMQFHFVDLSDIEAAMRRLAAEGLTTREACGNSVRNITACPYAGVAADELFDVTPYAEAMTRYLLRHPLSSTLPRKFKIAFEGCAHDHVATPINDIGWRARAQVVDGRLIRGFRVTAGGGTSIMCRSGYVLYDFLPASEILNAAEAILRVFHRLGDYQHKQRNRMKFLIRTMGWESFRAEVLDELQQFRDEGGARLPFDPEHPPVEDPPFGRAGAPPLEAVVARAAVAATHGPGIHPEVAPRLTVQSAEFLQWAESNVRAQKQAGFAIVTATTVLGDLTAGQLRILGELAASFSDGTVRITPEQNVLLRWVPRGDVQKVYRYLAAAGLARSGAGTLSDVTSCPGAESCRLAVTQSRGLGRVLGDALIGRTDLVSTVPGLDIKISGCPNGCGHHHIAGIGFQGSLRKVGGRPAPHYFVMVGGGIGEDASFGRHIATVPARRCVDALDRLLDVYRRARQPDETARAFFQRADTSLLKSALADLERLSPDDAQPLDFVDLGEDVAFQPDVQEGECSA